MLTVFIEDFKTQHMNIDINTYCINLDQRSDRRVWIKEEVKKIGITIEMFSGIKMDDGWKGCLASHTKLLNQVKGEGVFMIIEDDLLFMENALDNINLAISQLPDGWSMLYLGATLNQPLEKVSPNLLRIKQGWTTHGIIYNNQNGVVDFILDKDPDIRLDIFLSDVVQEQFNCYMCYPMVATQKGGWSDVVNRWQPYKIIIDRYKKYVLDYIETENKEV